MHKNDKKIMVFNFSSNGDYLATMSTGTLLKIAATHSGIILFKIWTKNKATIFSSICFSPDNSLVVVNEAEG